MPNNIKITNLKPAIAIPLTYQHVPTPFFDNFILLHKPEDCIYLRATNGPIDDLRNDLVNHALKINCSHIIMMDTDMLYHPKTIVKLLTYDLPVVGALCYRRYPPFDPLMFRGEVNHYRTIMDWKEGDLVEVDATGTGCIVFHMDVFRNMPPPWFKFRQNEEEEGIIGEDIGFCSDLRKAGYKIYVDTSVPSSHLTTLEVNHQTWLLYRAVKSEYNKKITSETSEIFEKKLEEVI